MTGAGVKLGRFGELVPVRGFSRWRGGSALDDQLRGSCWRAHDGLVAISSSSPMFLPGTGDSKVGPTWLVSATVTGLDGGRARPGDEEMRRVVEAFQMPAHDEDNHHPGVARHLFCPEDPEFQAECECKLSERVVVEGDGYQWTTPVEGECRGCEYERLVALVGLSRPCRFHGRGGISAGGVDATANLG